MFGIFKRHKERMAQLDRRLQPPTLDVKAPEIPQLEPPTLDIKAPEIPKPGL